MELRRSRLSARTLLVPRGLGHQELHREKSSTQCHSTEADEFVGPANVLCDPDHSRSPFLSKTVRLGDPLSNA